MTGSKPDPAKSVLPRNVAEAAEGSWDLLRGTTAQRSLTRSVDKRYQRSGTAGLRRRTRHLLNKRHRSASELAELHVLDLGIRKATAKRGDR